MKKNMALPVLMIFVMLTNTFGIYNKADEGENRINSRWSANNGCSKDISEPGFRFSTKRSRKPFVINSAVDYLDKLLKLDPDVRELIDIRQEITQRVIDRNVSITELRAAYQNRDEKQFRKLMEFTNADIKSLQRRISKSRTAILDRYPEIENLMSESDRYVNSYNPLTGNRKTGEFADHLSSYSSNYLESELVLEYEEGGDVTCRWAPYIAGLAVCTTLGPILYWPCAYVALCSFCSGGWVDSACV
jgi:hypothetical protein